MRIITLEIVDKENAEFEVCLQSLPDGNWELLATDESARVIEHNLYDDLEACMKWVAETLEG